MAQVGIDFETCDSRRLLSVMLGWLLDGKTQEQREELLEMLDGGDRSNDSGLAEAYREDGYDDLRVRMMEEIRHAKTPGERARIRVKYQDRAKAMRGD